MTPKEIASDFRQAKDRSKQIGILADLNECSKEEIVAILRAEGVDARQLPRKRKTPPAGNDTHTHTHTHTHTPEAEDAATGTEDGAEASAETPALESEATAGADAPSEASADARRSALELEEEIEQLVKDKLASIPALKEEIRAQQLRAEMLLEENKRLFALLEAALRRI